MGRQLRHWTKKVRQPFGAPTSGVRATGATTPGDDDFEAGPVQAWFTQLIKATQGIKQSLTPSARKRLKFTPEVSSAELAQELPFSEEPGPGPWDTPSERVESIKKSITRSIRKKAAGVAKKKGKSLAKKALDWKTWKTP